MYLCINLNAQITIDCATNIQTDAVVISENYTANSPDSLSSRAVHDASTIVVYEAQTQLCFENGFEIAIGTEATLNIASCNTICPCDGISCSSGFTCIGGICVSNTTLSYGDCTVNNDTTSILGDCSETLAFSPSFTMTISGGNRIISCNNIPDHQVGLFGMGPGSLNPNAISPQSSTYSITVNPTLTGSNIELLGTTGGPMSQGPQYSFGILLNGIELDPVAAEPWPHQGIMNPNVNWEWNLEALGLGINLGLDCNFAHVQPTGKYHYHGTPNLFLDDLSIDPTVMTLIGYAADGFPIYYKYAYEDADDANSTVIAVQSSFRLKSCERPGDGITAPCGDYDGTYSNDWEYIEYSGSLDECNGRYGVTPEYPSGTYYYVITDQFPSIPRCFKGTPSSDFDI